MDIAAIRLKSLKMGAGGIDARTITVEMEVVLGRGLTGPEAQAVVDGWRESEPQRRDRARKRDQRAADQVAGRVPAVTAETVLGGRRPAVPVSTPRRSRQKRNNAR